MDARLRTFAAQLHAASRAHDASQPDRLDRYRNLEPETAELLALLVRACGARRVLELVTSNGYSTLWLADAVAATGGGLTSVEIDPARTAVAAANLERADLRTADAADLLRASADGEWDLIFLDAERPAYAGYWPDLHRTLRRGGLLAVDNVVSHESELRELTALITAEPGALSTLVPVGAGVRLVVRTS